MNKQPKIVSAKGKAELSSREQELLKGAFMFQKVTFQSYQQI